MLLGLDARIAMALHAVFEVLDALLQVLRANLGGRVLMATVAGVATVVVVLVAGLATCLMVAIKHEVLVVIERGGLPGLGPVAGLAATLDLPMQPVGRRAVTAFASIEHGLGQVGMVELRRLPGSVLMALPAFNLEFTVNGILRCGMA